MLADFLNVDAHTVARGRQQLSIMVREDIRSQHGSIRFEKSAPDSPAARHMTDACDLYRFCFNRSLLVNSSHRPVSKVTFPFLDTTLMFFAYVESSLSFVISCRMSEQFPDRSDFVSVDQR